MKKTIIIFTILLAFANMGCKKKSVNPMPPGTIYRGVVLKGICCQVVVQTIGPNYLGQVNWKDESDISAPVYDHVFKVANPCQFGGMNGDTINFQLVPKMAQTCACCMLYTATPDSAYSVGIVK